MKTRSTYPHVILSVLLAASGTMVAQVHYDGGSPWSQRADSGPDAEVPGWYYNLGLTGIRAELVANEPKALLVKYVLPKTPARKGIEIDDLIIGVDGKKFRKPHLNGYGMEVFGAQGPIEELAEALEACQGESGKLTLTVKRGGETIDVELDIGTQYGSYAKNFPDDCPKSEKILEVKESHPDSYPTGPKQAHGGWGHNPGFEGYGPISMITAQGALSFALMERCGIEIDPKRHEAAYDFLKRGTGENGYVGYGDSASGPDEWADMGRTGAAGIACFLAPKSINSYRRLAQKHTDVIGKHPQSFPDTHASPPMGMAYEALGANIDPGNFRKLMDANRWWCTMAQCGDETFFYQPNRDNSGYDSSARLTASCVVAFIYTIPKRSLVITGKASP